MSSVNRHGINYQPFDALEGYKDEINKRLLKYNKVKRPSLSEDQEQEINNTLLDALTNDIEIEATYFLDGAILIHRGNILKIDIDYIIFKDKFRIKKYDLISVIL